MDALSDVLRMIRLTGGIFLDAEMTEPFCLQSAVSVDSFASLIGPASHLVLFHYVADGELIITLDDSSSETFHRGEVAILPRNPPHTLSGREPSAPISALDVTSFNNDGNLDVIRYGGSGNKTKVVCGFLGGDSISGNPLFASLPAVVKFDVLQSGSGAGSWIRACLEFAAEKKAVKNPGDTAVLARMAELLFVEAIRDHIQSLDESETGWLAGLRDPMMNRALSIIHARVTEQWTTTKLGAEIGLSRAALADRFTRFLGEPPMQYLTKWRLYLAADKLINDRKPIAAIAHEVGYDSEAAFSRAFKRVYGVAPSRWGKATAGK